MDLDIATIDPSLTQLIRVQQNIRSFVYNNKLYIISNQYRKIFIVDINTKSINSIDIPTDSNYGLLGGIGIVIYGSRAYVYSEDASSRTGIQSQYSYFYYINLNNDTVVPLTSSPTAKKITNTGEQGEEPNSAQYNTFNMFMDTKYNQIYLVCHRYDETGCYWRTSYLETIRYVVYHIYCYNISSNSWINLHKQSFSGSAVFRPSQGALIDSNQSIIKVHTNIGGVYNYEYIINRGATPTLTSNSKLTSTILSHTDSQYDYNSYANVAGMCDNRIAVHGNKLFKYDLFSGTTSGEGLFGAMPSLVFPASYAGGVSFWNNRFWYYNGKALYSVPYN